MKFKLGDEVHEKGSFATHLGKFGRYGHVCYIDDPYVIFTPSSVTPKDLKSGLLTGEKCVSRFDGHRWLRINFYKLHKYEVEKGRIPLDRDEMRDEARMFKRMSKDI